MSEVTTAYLSFQVDTIIQVTDTLEIGFPDSIGVSTVTYVYIENSNSYDFSPSVDLGSNSVTIEKISAFDSSIVELQIFNVTNPPSETTTTSFTLVFRRNGEDMKQLASNTLKFNARRGIITGNSLTSTSLEIGTSADYTF